MPKKIKEVKNLQKGKILNGTVVSLKMQDTALIEVERKMIHPLYKKVISKRKKYKVDKSGHDLNIGDKVIIIETKPISKNKYFKVQSKLNGGGK